MSDDLRQEKRQTFRTMVALLMRRDVVYAETGEDPLDGVGQLIKACGAVRDTMDIEDVPDIDDIDPAEVFDDGDD